MNEMRMLRWMCGVTKKDTIINEHVRVSVKVAPVTKVEDARTGQSGRMTPDDGNSLGRRMIGIEKYHHQHKLLNA